MSILSIEEQKEQKKINDLEEQIRREKEKLDKKLTRQKILLGAFFIDMLETDKVVGVRDYTARNLEQYLSRKGDKELMSEVIDSLKKPVTKPTQQNNNAGEFGNSSVD